MADAETPDMTAAEAEGPASEPAPEAPRPKPRPPKQPIGPTSVNEVLARLRATGAPTAAASTSSASTSSASDDPAPEASTGEPAGAPVEPVETSGADDVLAQAAEVIDGAGQTVELERLVAERTDDLQRIQAEYANYRKRVERDKSLAKQQGVNSVVRELMPILDAIAQAEEHEELTGGFKVVVGEFTRLCEKLGLVQFGAVGDEFDPNLHEALMAIPAPDVAPGRIAQVIQPGYSMGDDVLRPARVAVAAGAD